MNFAFSQEEQIFLKDLDKLMEDYSSLKDLEGGSEEVVRSHLMGFLKKLPDYQYLKFTLSSDENTMSEYVILMKAMEMISKHSPSLLLSLEMSARTFGRIISKYGNSVQKDQWLPDLLQGKMIGAVALSEKAMNIENDQFETGGIKRDDGIEINGKKRYVVNAPIADWIAVCGNYEGENAVFLVSKDSEGLVIGKRMFTLGYDGAAISDVTFTKCVIPLNQLILSLNKDDIIVNVRQWENQILIGSSLGIMQSAFDSANAYAREHTTGGKPIIAYQEVSFKLAEMITLLQTAQLLAYRTAWHVGESNKDAESLIYCAKVFCTEAAEKVASEALQILSGNGYSKGSIAERSYRYAKYCQIAGTSTELSRMKIADVAFF